MGMNEIEKIQEERFIESLMYLWIAQDAPDWIKDYVREELRKQRGLVTEPKKQSRYSETIMDELIDKMNEFLKTHKIYKLMELVTSVIAMEEQENSHKTCTSVNSVQDSCNPQHCNTIVRCTPDKNGWRVGAYVKDPCMFEHGNNTGK